MNRTPIQRSLLLLPLFSAALSAQDAAPPPVPATPSGTVFVDRPRADEPTVWLRGDRYKASVDAAAMTYIPYLGADAPHNVPIRFTVSSVSCGGVAIDSAPGAVETAGDRVVVRRAGFAEIYDAAVTGLEQSFRFDALPVRGDLAITLALSSEAVPALDGGDVVFTSPWGVVRYAGLCAVDAEGRRRTLPIRVDAGQVHLDVPADFVATAALPLVVDPLLYTVTVAPTVDMRMAPDLAWNEQAQEHLVIWRVPYSATDWDVAAIRTDFWMNPIGTSFWIDFTSAHWVSPRVACKQLEGMFLVVGETSSGSLAPFSITGRRYEAFGTTRTLHPTFDIQRAGQANHLAGEAYVPDVGGDPWMGGGAAYFTVVWEHHLPGQNGDIAMRQIRADGSFVAASPTIVNNGPYDDRAPSISKSSGQGLYGIAWTQFNTAANLGDIVAAEYNYDGTLRVAPFYVETSVDNDTMPRISTPAHVQGQYVLMLAWQRNYDPFSNYGRLRGAVITNNPLAVMINRFDLTALLGVPSSTMAYEPAVDSDGLRFTLTHTEVPAAAPGTGRNNLYASTFALDGASLLVHENRAVLQNTGPSAFASSIASHFGGSLLNTRTYAVVGGTSAISNVGWIYNGHQPGSMFSVRNAGCGGLPIGYSGYTSFGDSVTFDVGGYLGASFAALQIGFPTPLVPLGPCPSCLLGVNGVGTVPPHYTWTVPYLPSLVGVTLSVQGFAVGAGPCYSSIALSNVIDFTLR